MALRDFCGPFQSPICRTRRIAQAERRSLWPPDRRPRAPSEPGSRRDTQAIADFDRRSTCASSCGGHRGLVFRHRRNGFQAKCTRPGRQAGVRRSEESKEAAGVGAGARGGGGIGWRNTVTAISWRPTAHRASVLLHWGRVLRLYGRDFRRDGGRSDCRLPARNCRGC